VNRNVVNLSVCVFVTILKLACSEIVMVVQRVWCCFTSIDKVQKATLSHDEEFAYWDVWSAGRSRASKLFIWCRTICTGNK